MKVAIYGAGAIGGLIGGHLARTGQDVTLIARGAHLTALKEKGLHIHGMSGDFTVHPKATEHAIEAGPQDFVIVALKANAVPGIADKLAPLLGANTAVVMAVNGMPWWYFYGQEGALKDARIPAVDPDGKLWDLVGPQRVIGCVVYPAAEVVAPGEIRHVENDRFSLGEASGEKTERVQALSAAFIAAGFKAPVKTDIRTEIWVKLWGNVAFNPLSALTGGTLAGICSDPDTRAVAKAIMGEAEAIANALGVKMPIDVEKRINGAAGVGEHKTSMLQDIERGRPIELEAIVGAVRDLGRLVHVPTPMIDTIYALVKQKAGLLGLL
ncbi:2-dehydropantoate 2-reductase [Dongia rigui]|uniref:2-dehydropantoate 2-reductase n=1 Tax=Dongia rigui TaxID=940149 RepID=A0ABU5E0C4_9PROT|nr:2-dehydropantoate 2-reductase [Dongia rigui]MDY0872630.1 2-dehydropantoate 2-reductase [Dongia rigui]